MAVAPIEPHALHSERLILHAEREIARGDRLQSSEKACGNSPLKRLDNPADPVRL